MESDIIYHLERAQKIAEQKYQIKNILQPGIIKELILAEKLNHKLITNKDRADAEDHFGSYEYLCSIRRVNTKTNRGCSFQMDRVTNSNLSRITRNKRFYFGIFKSHLELEKIISVETSVVLEETKRQLDNCKNEIAHINFLLKWVEENGKLVFENSNL